MEHYRLSPLVERAQVCTSHSKNSKVRPKAKSGPSFHLKRNRPDTLPLGSTPLREWTTLSPTHSREKMTNYEDSLSPYVNKGDPTGRIQWDLVFSQT